jgi:NAD(P)-dependent dehydrogenase (short-subunit alcohol dehydrogenase family)
MAKKISNSGFHDWSPNRLPDLSGKTYLITGGNSGIGLEAAKMLAGAGANLIIGARNPGKGRQAVTELTPLTKGSVELVSLDLADMKSIHACAKAVRKLTKKLDGQINNAGIMQTPQLATADGFEMQFGTNHLGHFLLDGLLFDLVEKAKGRIVTVSSLAHKFGEINFDDLPLADNYSPTKAYTQSKLANLMYAIELDRRLKQAGSSVTSYACHPGYSNTALQSTGPEGFLVGLYKFTNTVIAQPARNGAIPTVLCAAGTEAVPGGYYGPQSMREARGRVSDATVAGRALNVHKAARLWLESERLVDFDWDDVLC